MTTISAESGWVPEESFGARLALVRQRFGWNVKEAALACGLPVQSWRGWERDNMHPRDYLQVCRQIAQHTGASYDWLLDGRRPQGEPTEEESGQSDGDVRHEGLEPPTRWLGGFRRRHLRVVAPAPTPTPTPARVAERKAS